MGIRDLGGLESAIAQPQMSFGGNKRIGHAAMEMFLVINGFELQADVDEAEKVILDVASGAMSRHDFVAWVKLRTVSRANAV